MFSPRAFSRFILAAVSLSLTVGTLAQNAPTAARESAVWREVDERTLTAAMLPARAATAKREIVPLAYRTLQLDQPAMQALLRLAPREFSAPIESFAVEIDIPMPYGNFSRFRVQESPIMEPKLAARYPQIKTYVGQGIDDPSATMRIDVTARGFRAVVLSARGQYFIDPYWSDDDTTYISYYKRNFISPTKAAFECTVHGKSAFDASKVTDRAPQAQRPTGATLRVYRLALACTGEYAAAVSGTTPGTFDKTFAAMVTTINRCSAVYERDLAIRFVLVNNTDKLVFLDPTTDGYSNNDGGAMLPQNQVYCDRIIGNANYDFGHVFSTGGGGIAGLGVVCQAGQKAQGVTGLPNPTGDPYDIDFVVHEMGHEFGADHPFNGFAGACGGGNRNGPTAYEVGSGTTIMAYAGICGNDNTAPHSDDYFHTISYDEIDAYTTTGLGTCATSVATGNSPPVIAALTNFTIPSQTPFALTASAADANGDTLTYCWEEFDLGPQQHPRNAPRDNGSSPIFRSFDPSPSPTRIFPSLTYILNNANVPPAAITIPGFVSTFASGEFLPTTSRTMTFRVTVRDNRIAGGGSNYASMTVASVATAGPFAITSPNTAATIAGGSAQTVTWNVANSAAAPINCANVKITLSTDGGNTFPFVLAASTPNSGTANVTIPNTANVATTQGRIKVEAIGNIFFDISDADLTLTSTNSAPTLTLTPGSITVVRGTPTATVALVATASDANADPLTVSVSDLPGDVTVTPTISSGNISLSVLANCTIVTTLTTRAYPITLTVTDSIGSTTSGTVSLNIAPNPAPTIGTYADLNILNTNQSVPVTPSVGPADANGNLLVNPVSVTPSVLPGGGTISVNPNTGVVTVNTTPSSTLAITPVRVTVQDSCGAVVERTFNVRVLPPTPAFLGGVASAPTSESCLPANGAVDPAETVTVNLPLTNTGGAATTNLVATLQATGGVTIVGSPARTFGALASLGSGSQPFSFVANGACGGTITATLQLQDGATNFGNVTYLIRLGAPATINSNFENFDSVSPPALPVGWTSTVVSGLTSAWTTSPTTPDTAPNAVFATPSDGAGESRLDSAAVIIPSALSQLQFRHRYLMEDGYDGGVLEISIAGGAFADIIAAGGSFVSGGYTSAVSQDTGVLNVRDVWTGDSVSYVTTLINLPAAAGGQSVRFRFRMSCDSSFTPAGSIWSIDSLRIVDNFFTCTSCGTAPLITSGAPPSPVTIGSLYTHTFAASGSPTPAFAVTAGTLPPGLSLSSAGVLDGTPTTVGTGSYPNITVTASNGVAPVSSQTFTLNVITTAANYLAAFGAVGGPRSDFDGDGLANLLEYALGFNPTAPNASPAVIAKDYAGTKYLSITYTRSSVATDLTYIVQGSDDLQIWATLASSTAGGVTSGLGFVSETGSAPTFTVEVRDTVPVSPSVKRFMRLRVTSP